MSWEEEKGRAGELLGRSAQSHVAQLLWLKLQVLLGIA